MTDNGQYRYWWVPTIVAALITATAWTVIEIIDPGAPAPEPSSTSTTAPEPSAIALDFDGGILNDAKHRRYVTDTTGRHRGYLDGLGAGQITTIARDGGSAIQFPAPCPEGCAAIIDFPDAGQLNPRDRDFAFGAWVRVPPEAKVPNANVLQKGLSLGAADPNQWKLELSGGGGRPTCVLIDKASAERQVATAPIDIADGNWHQIDCVREGNLLTVQVASVARDTDTLPDGLTIDNTQPLRLGGNTPGQADHRFAGALDDVYFEPR